jgi:hypothetical protein
MKWSCHVESKIKHFEYKVYLVELDDESNQSIVV